MPAGDRERGRGGHLSSHARIVDYDTYTYALRTLVMLIFVAAQAPELVSRDLRSHVLPLYYSRPLRRLDYPLAKYLAFTAACLLLVEIPLIILYLGTIVSVGGGSAVWGQTKALIPGLGVAALMAVLLAAIGLLLASLTGRRAYATGIIAIYFFLTWILARILVNVASHGAQPPPGPVPGPGHALVAASFPLGARLPRPDKPVHRCSMGCGSGWVARIRVPFRIPAVRAWRMA